MSRMAMALAAVAALVLPLQPANAWFHSGAYGTASGGGSSWNAHGYRGGTASGGGGSWNARGAYGGTASGSGGSWSAHGAYGGSASGSGRTWSANSAYGGSAYGSGGYWHATGAGGATASGYHTPGTAYYGGAYHYGGSYYGAYHPPVVVNTYGTSCLNCGGWGAGAVAAGVVAGAAVAGAAATANAAPSYGAIYATLPANCAFQPSGGVNYYDCNGLWLEPAFGANGVYYRSVAPP